MLYRAVHEKNTGRVRSMRRDQELGGLGPGQLLNVVTYAGARGNCRRTSGVKQMRVMRTSLKTPHTFLGLRHDGETKGLDWEGLSATTIKRSSQSRERKHTVLRMRVVLL